MSSLWNFYPRSPCGERPVWRLYKYAKCSISIHALLAESDNFIIKISTMLIVFLSTLSLRRATFPQFLSMPLISLFLSTLSLRRATLPAWRNPAGCGYFYPRSPCGERRALSLGLTVLLCISIHALLAESDFASLAQSSRLRIFLSTLSLRRATCALTGANRLALHFYPRSPCGERPCNGNGPFAGLIISIHALLAESDFVYF